MTAIASLFDLPSVQTNISECTHGYHSCTTDGTNTLFCPEILIIMIWMIINRSFDRNLGSDWILAILLYMALCLFVWGYVCFRCVCVVWQRTGRIEMTSSKGLWEQKRSLLPIRKSSHPTRHGRDFTNLHKLPKACEQTFSKKSNFKFSHLLTFLVRGEFAMWCTWCLALALCHYSSARDGVLLALQEGEKRGRW